MAKRSAARMGGIGLIALFGARLALADITIEQQVAIDGFGPMKLGAMEGKNVTAISKDAARTEHQTQLKSKFMRALVKGASGNTVQIIRLDQERIDEIDVANKQYTEISFQEMRDNMNQALQTCSRPRHGRSRPLTGQAGHL